MARLFRRSILWLVPIVIIPLGALLAVQYTYLRDLESKTVSAERSWLRDAAETVASDVDTYYRTATFKALTIEKGCLCDPKVMSKHFANAHVAGARTFFVVHFDNTEAFYNYFSPDGVEKKTTTEDEVRGVRLAAGRGHVAKKMKRAIPPPPMSVDERDDRQRIIMRPVVDGSQHVLGVAGVILDEG